MKFFLLLLVVSGFLGGVTYVVRGAPRLGLACEVAKLKVGHVCLSQLEGRKSILWVDARGRKLWEENGMGGSVLWNLEEDQAVYEEVVMPALLTAPVVVVYCDTELCGTSEKIAEKIRGFGIGNEVWVLQGGYEALRGSVVFGEKLRGVVR